jgi:hypothetical protein
MSNEMDAAAIVDEPIESIAVEPTPAFPVVDAMPIVAEPDAPTDDANGQTAAAADDAASLRPSPPSAPQVGIDSSATLSVAEAKVEAAEETIMAESAPPKTPEPDHAASIPAAAASGDEENEVVNVHVDDDKMTGKRERIEDGATDEMIPDAKVPTPSKAEPHVGCIDNVACAAPPLESA